MKIKGKNSLQANLMLFIMELFPAKEMVEKGLISIMTQPMINNKTVKSANPMRAMKRCKRYIP